MNYISIAAAHVNPVISCSTHIYTLIFRLMPLLSHNLYLHTIIVPTLTFDIWHSCNFVFCELSCIRLAYLWIDLEIRFRFASYLLLCGCRSYLSRRFGHRFSAWLISCEKRDIVALCVRVWEAYLFDQYRGAARRVPASAGRLDVCCPPLRRLPGRSFPLINIPPIRKKRVPTKRLTRLTNSPSKTKISWEIHN